MMPAKREPGPGFAAAKKNFENDRVGWVKNLAAAAYDALENLAIFHLIAREKAATPVLARRNQRKKRQARKTGLALNRKIKTSYSHSVIKSRISITSHLRGALPSPHLPESVGFLDARVELKMNSIALLARAIQHRVAYSRWTQLALFYFIPLPSSNSKT